MNCDVEVMQFFPSTLSYEQSQAMVDNIKSHFCSHGFGLWAIELNATEEFIGFTGLSRPRFEAHFTPCVEIGWRLAREHWGKGYAGEGR